MVMLVVVLTVMSGCLGVGGSGDSDGTTKAKKIQEEAIQNMGAINTYSFEITADAVTDEGEVHMNATGVTNRPDRRMRLEYSFHLEVEDSPPRDVEATSYVINDTMYVELQGNWRSRNISERNIWSNDRLNRQKRILENAEVELQGNETINGVETYVIKVEPDRQQLINVLENQPGQLPGSSVDPNDIESVTYRFYITHDTKLPKRVELDMTIESRGITVDETVVITVDDYNTETDIQLPEEANRSG